MDQLAEQQAAAAATGGPQGTWHNTFLHVYLKTTFGPIVELVGDSLLTRGSQSLDELFRHTSLEIGTLKKALLTLIQQDIVQPSYEIIPQRPGAPKKTRPPRVLYTIQIANLRHRTRFAAYLLYIKQMYNAECEVIMQTLLLHGKLSSKQIMDLTCANINEKNRLQAQEMHKQLALQATAAGIAKPAAYFPPPPVPADQRRSINEVFRKLIAARYIVRATGLVMPEDPSTAAPAATGSTAVNTDILATFLSNQSVVEKKAQAASDEAALSAGAGAAQAALKSSTAGKKRKKVIDDDDDTDTPAAAASADEDAKPARKKKKTKKEVEAEAAQVAREKKEEEMRAARVKEEKEIQASLDRSAQLDEDVDMTAGDGPTSSEEHVLWVVNHAQFLWEFRKKHIESYVSENISAAAGFLVRQLLEQYPSEVCHPTSPERPPVYDTEAIWRMCERAASDASIPNPCPTLEMVDETCDELLQDSTAFFERKSHPKGYLINFHQLFSELRLKHIQSICRARFGSLSARLFRCLLTHKRLEETQLSEYATAPRKDVRRLLYAMHNAKFISLQEVPRSSDRMPARTFFLWGVNTQVATETYLESLYFTWCNLRLRLEQETDAAKPILDKVDTSKPITDVEKAKIETWKKSADRLESGINQLNQLIMLFQDF